MEEKTKNFLETLLAKQQQEKERLSKMTPEEIEEERTKQAEARNIEYWAEFNKEFNEMKQDPMRGFKRYKCFEVMENDIRDELNKHSQFLSLEDYYPIISSIKTIKTPKTQFVKIEDGAIFFACIYLGYDNKFIPEIEEYIVNLIEKNNIQFPCFFKLATRSLKHALYGDCMIFQSKEEFVKSMPNIIAGMAGNYDNDGYVSNTFCFRELLDIDYTVKNYGQMPLINEYRTFIQDGKITALMPYYSYENFAGNYLDYREKNKEKHAECKKLYDSVVKLSAEDKAEIERISLEISKVIPAHHSLDIMQDIHGSWWVVDMQPAELSFGFELTQDN
jgi:hypothetical protein